MSIEPRYRVRTAVPYFGADAVFESEALEGAKTVGTECYACADFAQLGRFLVECDGDERVLEEGDGEREPCNAGADDGHL